MRRVWSVGVALVLLSGCVLQVSSDPFTNTTSQHRTQVEPDTFSFGSTIVGAFQSGRFFDGGSSDIGWTTSVDSGKHWTSGFLSGLTSFKGAGAYARVSDPAVAYDARHHVWLISSLALDQPPNGATAVLVSSSTDGITWKSTPVTVAASAGHSLDKEWIVCDNHPSSTFYGRCYVEYDDNSAVDAVHVTRSGDGGRTWTEGAVPAAALGLGGQPLVQPAGRIVVPYLSLRGTIETISSQNGGTTYSAPVTIGTASDHTVAGGLRTSPLPSAEIDASGRVYVVWQDCRFRTGRPCSHNGAATQNDIVMSTSANGALWSPVVRIPIDPISSTVDHFIPGLAVDASTSGKSAHLALVYYFYPQSNCTATSCHLQVGYINSTNGGHTWSNAQTIAGPMSLSWIAATNQGTMVGDYISTSFVGSKAFPIFAIAHAPARSTFDEAMNTVLDGLPVAGGNAPAAQTSPIQPAPAPRRSSTPLTAN